MHPVYLDEILSSATYTLLLKIHKATKYKISRAHQGSANKLIELGLITRTENKNWFEYKCTDKVYI